MFIRRPFLTFFLSKCVKGGNLCLISKNHLQNRKRKHTTITEHLSFSVWVVIIIIFDMFAPLVIISNYTNSWMTFFISENDLGRWSLEEKKISVTGAILVEELKIPCVLFLKYKKKSSFSNELAHS